MLLYSVLFSRRIVTRPALGLAVRSNRSNSPPNGRQRRVDFFRLGLRLFLRRHLAGFQHVLDAVPRLAVVIDRQVILELIEGQIGLGLAVAVAGEAILGEERENVFFVIEFAGGIFGGDRRRGSRGQG